MERVQDHMDDEEIDSLLMNAEVEAIIDEAIQEAEQELDS